MLPAMFGSHGGYFHCPSLFYWHGIVHPCSLNTCPVNIFCHFNCTDLGLRSRTFSLKVKLLHFLKSLKHDSVERLCLQGQMSSHTEFQLQIMFLTLDINPTTLNIRICTTHHKITQLTI